MSIEDDAWRMVVIDDPDFKVDSMYNYYRMIFKLAEWTIEMAQDYPDKRVLVTYLADGME